MSDNKWKAVPECPNCGDPKPGSRDMAILCCNVHECSKCKQHFYIDTKMFYRSLKVETLPDSDEAEEDK